MSDDVPAPAAFSKRDVENLVRQLVPPIARDVATEAAKAVLSEVTRAVSAEVSRGVTEAMTAQFRVLGIETGSADAISRQHRRNSYVDDAIAKKDDYYRRMGLVDDMARDYDPDDRAWVKAQRRRQERDGNTFRETVIRWIVPAVMGALLATGGFQVFEARREPAVVPAEQATREAEEPTIGGR